MSPAAGLRRRLARLTLAPDGKPRPSAPFGRGPLAAKLLGRVIMASSAAGGRLPAGVAHGVAQIGGTLEWAARPDKRRRLAENLSHAVARPPEDPAVRRLVRREVVNEARRSADLLWALLRPEEVLATTRIDGAENVREAAARGKGVVLAGLHVGGWEVATVIPKAVVPVRTTALVTDDWLAWAVSGLRLQNGLGTLYDSEPTSRALELLRRGEALLLLCDYAKLGMRTYPVRLLDGVAELPAGAVTLARLAGSPILPFAVLPLAPRRWRVLVEPPIEPPSRRGGEEAELQVAQELADRFTELLRDHADHWAAVYPMSWHGGAERGE